MRVDNGDKFQEIMATISLSSALITCITTYLSIRLIKLIVSVRSRSLRKRELPIPCIPYSVPAPHWYFGHVHLLKSAEGTKELCIDHASPSGLSTFWVMDVPSLAVLSAAHARKILTYNNYRDASKTTMLKKHYTMMLGEHSLIVSNNKKWVKDRATVQRAFTPASLINSQTVMCEVIKRCVDAVLCHVPKESDGLEFMKMMSCEVFGFVAMGYDFRCVTKEKMEIPQVARSFDFLQQEVSRRCYSFDKYLPPSQYYWMPTKSNREHAKNARYIRNLLSEIISQRREATKENKAEIEDLLGHILARQDRSLSDDRVCDFMITVLFGGFDTTSLTLSYAFHALAFDPVAERNCVDEVTNRSQNGGGGTLVAKDLPYCKAVILETLRLNPPAPWIIRSLTTATELEEGVTIPKGTRCHFSTTSIHRDERNFKRAKEFLPQRWVKWNPERGSWVERSAGDGEDENGIPGADRENLLSFSFGGRICVGYRFGMQQTITMLAYMVKDLKVSVPEEYRHIELKRAGPVQVPKDGLPMVITRRQKTVQ